MSRTENTALPRLRTWAWTRRSCGRTRSAPNRSRPPRRARSSPIYPHRWAVPRDIWRRCSTRRRRDRRPRLQWAFPRRDGGMLRLFADKARAGVGVRILLGDPDSAEVAQRGRDEGMGDAWPRRSAARWCSTGRPAGRERRDPLAPHGAVQLDLPRRRPVLVNTHVYGTRAGNSPVLHLRRVAGGDMVSTYAGELREGLGQASAGGVLTMARRIDYYDDPDAPAANSMVPSVNVVVTNDAGEILMIRRTDNDNWAAPRRSHRPGRVMPQRPYGRRSRRPASLREITGLVGIYTDPGTSSSTPATARPGRSSPSCSPPARSAAIRRRARSL